MKKILGRISNKFWLKNFSSFHWKVRLELKECLNSGFMPSCLTKGKTALMQKNKSKANIRSREVATRRTESMQKKI